MDFFLEHYEVAYRDEMAQLVDALESGAKMSPTIEDGLRAQLIADAAAKSLETGEPVLL